jgi:hypothetical protein
MTLDEAIERLKIIAEEQDEDWLDFEYFALQLGIEALKYVKKGREDRCPFSPSWLPGETEE